MHIKHIKHIKIDTFIKIKQAKNNMRRKIIKLGVGGSAIYLPKKWILKNKMNPRDEVNINETEEGLIISTEETKQNEKKIEIEIKTNSKNRLRTILASAYREGYTIIKIRLKKTIPIKEINEVVTSLTGAIITEQKENEIEIKNTISTKDENPKKQIEKMMISLNYQFSFCYDSIIEKKENIEEIIELAKTNIRQRDFIQKIINSKKEMPLKYEYYLLVNDLEKISGLLKLFGTEKVKINEKELKEIKEEFNELRKYFFKKDIDKLITLSEQISKTKKKAIKSKNNIFCLLSFRLFDLSSRCINITLNSTNIETD